MRADKAAKRFVKVLKFLGETDPNTPEGAKFVIKMVELLRGQEMPEGLREWDAVIRDSQSAEDWLNQ
jgi:hypothetical protein